MTWIKLHRGNLKRETKLLHVAAQAIRTNYIKIGIDKIQKSSKNRLFREKDKTLSS